MSLDGFAREFASFDIAKLLGSRPVSRMQTPYRGFANVAKQRNGANQPKSWGFGVAIGFAE